MIVYFRDIKSRLHCLNILFGYTFRKGGHTVLFMEVTLYIAIHRKKPQAPMVNKTAVRNDLYMLGSNYFKTLDYLNIAHLKKYLNVAENVNRRCFLTIPVHFLARIYNLKTQTRKQIYTEIFSYFQYITLSFFINRYLFCMPIHIVLKFEL